MEAVDRVESVQFARKLAIAVSSLSRAPRSPSGRALPGTGKVHRMAQLLVLAELARAQQVANGIGRSG